MKSTIKEKTEKQQEYPFIGVSKDSGLTILFSSFSTGTVISGNIYELGYYFDDWDMDMFKDFKGTVTLEN